MSDDPLDLLMNIVDPKESSLINLPDRIWVFGGALADNADDPAHSLRDCFWRRTLQPAFNSTWCSQLDRPEAHSNWWAFSGYDDLLEFERDACYLANLVILFPESPGSYAELGALSLDEALLSRLFVIVQSRFLNHDQRSSFLNLGPLSRVENTGQRCVISGNTFLELNDDDFQIIVDEITKHLPNSPNRSPLLASNPTHLLLFIADIIDLLHACKLEDIVKALKWMNIEMDLELLRKYLYLLDFFSLAHAELRGTELFAVRNKSSSAPWVDYKSKDSKTPFDRLRFKTTSFRLLEADSRRLSVWGRRK